MTMNKRFEACGSLVILVASLVAALAMMRCMECERHKKRGVLWCSRRSSCVCSVCWSSSAPIVPLKR